MDFFAKILNNFQLLTIFAKGSILDVWRGSEYASYKSLVRDFIEFLNGNWCQKNLYLGFWLLEMFY